MNGTTTEVKRLDASERHEIEQTAATPGEAQLAIDNLRQMLEHDGTACTCAETFRAVITARNTAVGLDDIAHDPELWKPADILEADKLGERLERILEAEAKKHGPAPAWMAFCSVLEGAAHIIALPPITHPLRTTPTMELAQQAVDHLQGMLTNGTNGHSECATTRGFIVAGKHVAVAEHFLFHAGDELWTRGARKASEKLFNKLLPMLSRTTYDEDAFRRVFQPFAKVTANYAQGFRYSINNAPMN
jgi:hypothetical protein